MNSKDEFPFLSGRIYRLDFSLDEDSLKRIINVVKKFTDDYSESTEIIYYIGHVDNSFYETTVINEIFDDPYPIDFIGIEMCKSLNLRPDHQTGRDWILRIVFNRNEIDKIKYTISSPDRNWSTLLSNELKPQIERILHSRKVSRWLISGFISSVFILCHLFFIKLDIFKRIPFITVKSSYYILLLLTLFTIFIILKEIKNRNEIFRKLLGPESIFLWGDAKNFFFEKGKNKKFAF